MRNVFRGTLKVVESLRASVQSLQTLLVLTVRGQWLIPLILATQEAEIRRIEVPGQPEQTVHKTLSQWKKAGYSGMNPSSQQQQEA
jgi:hypothetical protein